MGVSFVPRILLLRAHTKSMERNVVDPDTIVDTVQTMASTSESNEVGSDSMSISSGPEEDDIRDVSLPSAPLLEVTFVDAIGRTSVFPWHFITYRVSLPRQKARQTSLILGAIRNSNASYMSHSRALRTQVSASFVRCTTSWMSTIRS